MHLLPEEVEKLDGAANFRQVFMDLRELTDLRSNWFHEFGGDFVYELLVNRCRFNGFKRDLLPCWWIWSTLWIFSWTLLFRIQVNGFPVFGVGQPTEEGFLATLNKARALKRPILWYRWRQCNVLWWFERLWYTWRQCSMVILKVATSAADPPEKFIWFNVRKEPVVYINGAPASPRWWWWYGVFWIINMILVTIMMTITHIYVHCAGTQRSFTRTSTQLEVWISLIIWSKWGKFCSDILQISPLYCQSL